VPPPGFDDLPPEGKLEYVSALWDRIREEQDQLPLSDAQRQITRERLAAHRANPEAARPWPEVRAEIEQRLLGRTAR
jgi:putative addiction module component (TIGR02574 family)